MPDDLSRPALINVGKSHATLTEPPFAAIMAARLSRCSVQSSTIKMCKSCGSTEPGTFAEAPWTRPSPKVRPNPDVLATCVVARLNPSPETCPKPPRSAKKRFHRQLPRAWALQRPSYGLHKREFDSPLSPTGSVHQVLFLANTHYFACFIIASISHDEYFCPQPSEEPAQPGTSLSRQGSSRTCPRRLNDGVSNGTVCLLSQRKPTLSPTDPNSA